MPISLVLLKACSFWKRTLCCPVVFTIVAFIFVVAGVSIDDLKRNNVVLAYVYNFISSALRLNAAAEERRVRVAEELRARQQAERERIQQEVFRRLALMSWGARKVPRGVLWTK